jgi:hypothetical protein
MHVTIINTVKNLVSTSTSVLRARGNIYNKSEESFEQTLNKTEKMIEAQMMADAGVPLSVIAKTLDMKIGDILNLSS